MNAARGDVVTMTQIFPAHAEKLSRSVYVAVAGLACLPNGLLWDISHHSTIGRDTFWTPAHILIQLGGIVPAFLFASVALKTTFRGTPEERGASVSFWGLRAPLGVWVTVWGAVAMMTRCLGAEWVKYNITVNALAPGVFETPLNRNVVHEPGRKASIMAHTPMARFGEAHELVGAAIFLASSKASGFVTGADIRVEGGFLCHTI